MARILALEKRYEVMLITAIGPSVLSSLLYFFFLGGGGSIISIPSPEQSGAVITWSRASWARSCAGSRAVPEV